MLHPSTNFSNRISDSNNNRYGARTQTRISENYRCWNNTNPMADFTAERRLIEEEDDDDDNSGVFSPPLWRTSPTRSPQHRQNHYRSLSPSSKAQAIARGQKELMDMVSSMPEGCYELSLKDIVEHALVDADQANKREQECDQDQDREAVSFSKETTSIVNGDDHTVRSEKKKKDMKVVQMNRSVSMDNNGGGFLLKIVFPISWGSKKKKKKTINKTNSYSNSGMTMVKTNSGGDGRVSPKPLLLDGSAKNGEENEWWKNRFVEAAESESGGLSSNSGSSKSSGSSSSRSSSWNSSGRNGKGGCWFFIFGKREKKAA